MHTTNNVDWDTYRGNLYNFILKRVDNHTVAEDLVQEVLEKAYVNRESLQKADKLRSWLFQIARNTVIDHYRTHKSSKEFTEDLVQESFPSHETIEQELGNCLTPFIDQLPEHYQAAIKLSELDGLTQHEVAEYLNLSLSGVKSRVQRGREQLERMFLNCCKIELDSRGTLMDYEPHKACNNC